MTETETTETETDDKIRKPIPPNLQRLRRVVRFFYDVQKLRIQFRNRARKESEGQAPAELTEDDKVFLGVSGDGLKDLEKTTLKEIKRLLKKEPIYTDYLLNVRGVGPTMAGVLLAYANPVQLEAPTVSALWKWCGLAVVDGAADRRRKGEKANFNPWLKSKLVEVLADSFIKSNSPWKKCYDARKTQKENQIVTCMACNGVGTLKPKDKDGKVKKNAKAETCYNCEGKKEAPWGRSADHRHRDAKRYMVKLFLADYWEQSLKMYDKYTRPSYYEEKLDGHPYYIPGQRPHPSA